MNYKQLVLPIVNFKLLLDKISSPRLIYLYNWGESFFNPAIFKMVEYIKKKNILVQIDTNLSFKKKEDFFVNIVKSRLDILRISLDGASQESYSKYRIGGDFDRIISNIKKLVSIKNRLHADKPAIIWKFIVTKFNESEIEKAKKMAARLSIEFITEKIELGDQFVPDITGKSIEERKKYWLPKNNKEYVRDCYIEKYKRPLFDGICTQLFNYLAIDPNGKVFPCCWITDEKEAFGDLLKEPLEDIWYNNKYLYSRSLFTKEKYNGPKIQTICSTCTNYKSYLKR